MEGRWPIRVLWSCSKKPKMFPSQHQGKVQFGSIDSSLQYQDVSEHPVRQQASQTGFSCGLNNRLRVCGAASQHSNRTSTSCVLDPDWELVVGEVLSCHVLSALWWHRRLGMRSLRFILLIPGLWKLGIWFKIVKSTGRCVWRVNYSCIECFA